MKFSRRTLLGAGAGLLGSASVLSTLGFRGTRSGRKPKNIIFCVADGMAIQTMTMANHFQQIRDGRRSYWSTLMDEDYVVNGLQETRSLNSVVTDSAAASAAWGSGRRIWNGQLNMYPDGTELRTLTSLMSAAGVRCGLVTTTTITHATPAGFAVNCIQRDLEAEIAEKYLKAGVDVLFGGGNRFFDAASRKDSRNLYAEYEKAGFQVVRNRDDLLKAKGQKILGIFSDSHMPFTVDHENDPALVKSTPTLKEMARVALDNLRSSPNGFLLQIEGGKVDHAAHGNDLAGMIYDQIAFEDAVKEAVRFALEDEETLVIITTDHACGGPSLNGAGHEYHDSTAGLKLVENMKATYVPLFSPLGKEPSIGQIQEAVAEKLGVKLTMEEADAVAAAARGASPFRTSQFIRSAGATLATVLGNHTKVTWTSGNHTNDHVLVTALGPGKEACAGLTDNTSFFDIMLAAKELEHENPRMTYEEAAKHYQKLREKKVALLDAEDDREHYDV